MLYRLWYVLLTYATRPLTRLVWLFCLIVAVPWFALTFTTVPERGIRLLADDCSMIAISSVVLFLLLRSQIELYFSHAGARLIPNYVLPHLLPIGFLWLVAVVLHTATLQVAEVPFFAALGFSLLPWGICCGCTLAATPEGDVSSRRIMWRLVPVFGLILVGPTLHKLFVAFGDGTPFERYLQGREPVWALVFMISSLAAVAAYVRQSLRLSTSYCELGYCSPLCLTPDAPAAWRHEIEQQRTASPWRGSDRMLTRAINQASQPGWRYRTNLWRAGNHGFGMSGTFVTAAIILVMCSWQVASDQTTPPVESLLTVRFMNLAIYLVLFISTLSLSLRWRERRKLLEIESLRPTARDQFAHQIATAIAWDLVPVGMIYAVLLTLIMIFAVPQEQFGEWLSALLLLFVSLWVNALAICLWSIVVRRKWIWFLIQSPVFYASLIFPVQTALGGNEPEIRDSLLQRGAGAIAGFACVVGIAAAGMAWLAYRHWKAMEMASCSLCDDE